MIKIIDNFFKDNVLVNLQNHITTRLQYTPQFFQDATEKTKENHYGDRFHLSKDANLFSLFVNTAEEKFKIKLKKVSDESGIDLRNLDHFKPHVDVATKINILVMLKGPTAVTNGTVFYSGSPDDCVLDIHVGFKENRAVMFPSNWVHSQHASPVKNLRRYTATLFVEDYD